MLEFTVALQHNFKTSIWEAFWVEEQRGPSPKFWFSPHLLPSHQEEVHSSNVDIDVLTEILEDFPYEWARAEGDGRAGAVRKHHAALAGRSLPRANRVAIITLDVRQIHVQPVLWQLFNIYFKKWVGLRWWWPYLCCHGDPSSGILPQSCRKWPSQDWYLTTRNPGTLSVHYCPSNLQRNSPKEDDHWHSALSSPTDRSLDDLSSIISPKHPHSHGFTRGLVSELTWLPITHRGWYLQRLSSSGPSQSSCCGTMRRRFLVSCQRSLHGCLHSGTFPTSASWPPVG